MEVVTLCPVTVLLHRKRLRNKQIVWLLMILILTKTQVLQMKTQNQMVKSNWMIFTAQCVKIRLIDLIWTQSYLKTNHHLKKKILCFKSMKNAKAKFTRICYILWETIAIKSSSLLKKHKFNYLKLKDKSMIKYTPFLPTMANRDNKPWEPVWVAANKD